VQTKRIEHPYGFGDIGGQVFHRFFEIWLKSFPLPTMEVVNKIIKKFMVYIFIIFQAAGCIYSTIWRIANK
jgi:hypothetical protein